MFNDSYEKAREIIDARRNGAITEANKRSAALRILSPELKSVDEELSGTGLLIFKTACMGGDINPIKVKNAELNKKRREIIKSLGYPEDYTDIRYTCPKCSDTGYVDIYTCSCFKELLFTESIKASGMGSLIDEQSFENFDLDFFGRGTKERLQAEGIVREAKAFAEGFGGASRGKNLLLIGKTGTGKTHISTSIAKRVIAKGYTVLYDSAQNIISAFETDRFHSGYGKHEPIAGKYLECDLLILDDLGTEYVNQFTISCLYNILNTRKNHGLSTIVSTNLSGAELAEKYDDRIYSRIIGRDYNVLYFAGDKDYRLLGKR